MQLVQKFVGIFLIDGVHLMGSIYLVKMSFMWKPDFLRLIRSLVLQLTACINAQV
jgi:hypothetical protein